MSDYLKSTNFATKDSLPSGNPGKIVKGTEIDNEFNAIADAIESKADLLNPVFSGLLTTDTLTTGGATNIGGTLAVAADTTLGADVQMTGTGRVLFPKGTTAQRPASPTAGSVRFNTTLGYLENYNGTTWLPVGYVTPADVSDKENTSTGYFQVPRGNIAQRPVSPVEGLIRYNSETDIYEGYTNGEWHRFLTVNQGVYTISYLVVGGGGGSGGGYGEGGGGGGQMVASTTTAVPGTTVLTMTIGGGGAGGATGSTSQIVGVGSANGGSPGYAVAGADGDHGGMSGNGYEGGIPTVRPPGYYGGGGGGGGAGGVGGNGYSINEGLSSGGYGGSGGAGAETLITGTSQFLAGGGGGGGQNFGGSGTHGGGNGSGGGVGGSNGTANTGGGGGGDHAGGSGVIYLKMPTVNYTGTHTGSPTISTTGSFTVLKYTGSGTYTC